MSRRDDLGRVVFAALNDPHAKNNPGRVADAIIRAGWMPPSVEAMVREEAALLRDESLTLGEHQKPVYRAIADRLESCLEEFPCHGQTTS